MFRTVFASVLLVLLLGSPSVAQEIELQSKLTIATEALDQNLPQVIAKGALRADSVNYDGSTTITYHYTFLKAVAAKFPKDKFTAIWVRRYLPFKCNDKLARPLLKLGVTVRHEFLDKVGEPVLSYSLTEEICSMLPASELAKIDR